MGLSTEDFQLPHSDETVKLRGLSGFEVMLSRKKHQGDDIKLNAFILSCAMGVTEDEALEWMKTHLAGDYAAVLERAEQLSGLADGAAKQAYRDFEADPGSEFRLLPGQQAGDDSRPAAAGDQ